MLTGKRVIVQAVACFFLPIGKPLGYDIDALPCTMTKKQIKLAMEILVRQ